MRFSRLMKGSMQHINTLLFIGGFTFDLFILPEAGHIATIWIGLLYLSIVAISIVLREWVISRNTATETEQRIFSMLTFAIAYFSGSALSFVCVYALRSAIFAVSWPLLLILLLCVLVNELVSSHHFRFTLDVGVFLVALFFFVVFNMPILLKVQNDVTFIISTVVAVGFSLLYVYLVSSVSESASEEAPKLYALSVGIPMFIGMMYFLNVIPAVPLSLAEAGVYHSVERNDKGVFIGIQEKDSRFLSSFRTNVYHLTPKDGGVFFFSAVNAPAKLSAPISHVWEYYDPATHRWVEKTVVAFTLAGGREEGYRAYSEKENIQEGLWRVTVKVDAKRIVGRLKFYITKSVDGSVETVEKQL
jgi:hypothetical protein